MWLQKLLKDKITYKYVLYKGHINLISLLNCELILKIKSLGKVFVSIIFN